MHIDPARGHLTWRQAGARETRPPPQYPFKRVDRPRSRRQVRASGRAGVGAEGRRRKPEGARRRPSSKRKRPSLCRLFLTPYTLSCYYRRTRNLKSPRKNEKSLEKSREIFKKVLTSCVNFAIILLSDKIKALTGVVVRSIIT